MVFKNQGVKYDRICDGCNGQLGHDMMLELKKRGWEAVGSSSGEEYRGEDAVAGMPYVQMDITDAGAVQKILERLRPDVVFHCSAWIAVDAAEDAENAEKVYALNVMGPDNIAAACEKIGAKMVYLSTDYVFGGQGERPWQPDDSRFAPLNEYGRTKLEDERAVAARTDRFFIVRISWVFGKNGKNLIR